MMEKKVLIIASHPDDEVLGAGGTILKLIKEENANVYLCVVTEAVKSLKLSKEEGIQRRKEVVNSSKMLGIKKTFFLDFPSLLLDTIPIFDIINKLQEIIKEVNPETVFSHYGNDPNQDHKIVSQASLVATNPNCSKVKEVYFYEIPSSTTYSTGFDNFCPNTFVDIEKYIDTKVKILKRYKSEIREYPHPRSMEGVKTYSQFRGLMCNKNHAEAFILYRRII